MSATNQTNETNLVAPGDFSWWNEPELELQLSDMWRAVCTNDAWAAVTQYGGFFLSSPDGRKVHMSLKYGRHNGTSLNWGLLTMQMIGRDGWDKYVSASKSLMKKEENGG